MVPKIGKDVIDTYEKLQKLGQEFEKHHQTVNKSEGDKLDDYLTSLEKKEGSIYEKDVITKLISNI